ncbi:hypothetical protein [Burkholderia latens]|uniref:Uncharacterized protein n=1 Tax=Burkholderia latens TaxID=488446 RepID=A0A6H9TIE9_9BURK|nr:hypothetical protein [Burkholderia latens]KAB0637389.1 hypothetical protein F7R21_21415 [Burkholderia latens]VWB75669.1 hypothetical protein BLA24064_03555 [Burkholderia latens]
MTAITLKYSANRSLYLSVDSKGRLAFSDNPSIWNTDKPVTSDEFENVTLQLDSPGNTFDKRYLSCPPIPASGNPFLMLPDANDAARLSQVGPNIDGFPVIVNGLTNAFLNRTGENDVIVGSDGSQGFIVTPI